MCAVAISGFATMIPEIAEIVGNQPKYNGSYKVRVVITGVAYVPNNMYNMYVDIIRPHGPKIFYLPLHPSPHSPQ